MARIVKEHGRLDVLVDAVAGEDPLMGQWASFWKVKLDQADKTLRQSLVSHIITAKHVAAVMIEQKRGLIVEVTENDSLGGGGNPLAWSVKLAVKGLALNMASELHPVRRDRRRHHARLPALGVDARRQACHRSQLARCR